ncbi:MAG: tyrosine-type recombinase/integrase [Oligoflexia bacterium]|nr:tyrosine-type recombinase/integrase [Oligoflexia bacterium]
MAPNNCFKGGLRRDLLKTPKQLSLGFLEDEDEDLSLEQQTIGISVGQGAGASAFFDQKLLRTFFLELLSTQTAYSLSPKELDDSKGLEQLLKHSHTIQNYKCDLKKFFSFLVACKFPLEVQKLSYGDHALVYKMFLISSFAPKTVERNLSALKKFWDFLKQEGLVVENIFEAIKVRGARVIRETNALTKEQIKRIFCEIENNLNPQLKVFEKMLFSLFLGTGARKSEILSLRRADFIRKQGVHHLVLRGKRGKMREVPLLDAVKVTIEDYLAMMSSIGRAIGEKDFLVQNQYNRSGGCCHETIERVIKKYLRLAEIDERITPHSLRASVITHLYQQGVDVVDISEYVGHASVETTKGYIKRAKRVEESPGLKISLFS